MGEKLGSVQIEVDLTAFIAVAAEQWRQEHAGRYPDFVVLGVSALDRLTTETRDWVIEMVQPEWTIKKLRGMTIVVAAGEGIKFGVRPVHAALLRSRVSEKSI